MTDFGRTQFRRLRAYEGVFIRHVAKRRPDSPSGLVVVQLPGYKRPQVYHESYWEAIGAAPEPAK